MDHLSPNVLGEKKKKNPPPEVRPRDGHVEDVFKIEVLKIENLNLKVYLSQTAWTFGFSCVAMSKIRYFLQITWF